MPPGIIVAGKIVVIGGPNKIAASGGSQKFSRAGIGTVPSSFDGQAWLPKRLSQRDRRGCRLGWKRGGGAWERGGRRGGYMATHHYALDKGLRLNHIIGRHHWLAAFH